MQSSWGESMDYCLWCDTPFYQALTWNSVFGLTEPDKLCEECRQSLTIISGEICRVCGRMLEKTPKGFVDGDTCLDCIRWEMIWPDKNFKNRSLYVYDDKMKEWMTRFKFRGDVVLSEAITSEWKKLWLKECQNDIIVPIPLSGKRLYERGFNQSLVLAQLLDGEIKDILTRQNSEKQSKKSRSERLQTNADFFQLKVGINLSGAKIVLIDDIYTTGTTVRNAAQTLFDHGARSVSSLTLARGF